MWRYILKRLLIMIPVVLCVAVVIFTIMYFSKGDPVIIALGSNFTQEQYLAMQHKLGLDQPYIVQLLQFLKQTFIDWDFGTSYLYNTSVSAELFSRLPRTMMIGVCCCILELAISVPLGVTAALHRNGILDRVCILLAMLAISLPNFWVALMMILVFSLYLGWLPATGIEHWYSYILPIVANTMMGLGGMTRQMRSSMLETIRSDYVTTARAKGVPERQVIFSHALPNAMIPVIANTGMHFGMAIGGAVVIETVFSIPGVGYYMMTAVNERDYPVVRGGVVLLSIIFCLIMLLTDVAFAFIDPRIKAQYESQNKKRMKKNKRKDTEK